MDKCLFLGSWFYLSVKKTKEMKWTDGEGFKTYLHFVLFRHLSVTVILR